MLPTKLITEQILLLFSRSYPMSGQEGIDLKRFLAHRKIKRISDFQNLTQEWIPVNEIVLWVCSTRLRGGEAFLQFYTRLQMCPGLRVSLTGV